MKKLRIAALVVAPIALGLLLVGCADSSESMPGMTHDGMSSQMPSAEAQGEFTMADSMFAMMMIPHHEQAIEMSDIILAKSGIDQRVLDLAQQIKDAQTPEIEQMQSWLDDWGMPSGGDAGGMGGMDHGDGMMSEDDMAALEAADGAEAARLFLEQMIEHHEGAIDMAEVLLAEGGNPEALALAESIIESQTAEIATMRELLTEI